MSQPLVFAWMQAHGGDERESLLLAHSIRAFAGALDGCPLWMLEAEGADALSPGARRALQGLGVQLFPFQAPPAAFHFPYALKVFAAARAEGLAEQAGAPLLAWMDSDSLVVNPPLELLLPQSVQLGFRPVMLRNISAPWGAPLPPFWELVCHASGAPLETPRPLLTGVDQVIIHPHINAGLLSLRPAAGLLRAWQALFARLLDEPRLEPFYAENRLYRIFLHQAALAACALARLPQSRWLDLGSRFNYPLFLHERIPPGQRAANLEDLATLRYDALDYFSGPGWESAPPMQAALAVWIRERMASNA